MAAKDSYFGPFTLEEPDDSWIVPMSEHHESGLDTSAGLPQDNNTEGTNASMEDPTSGSSEVGSSMDNGQQVQEATEPTSSNAGASTDASTGSKRELDSPSTEQSPKTKTRRRRGDAEPDYSGLTREKVKNNKRTGQACDRCKLRKLRCDAGSDGCCSCRTASHPCQVTDRVTGETLLRGEASQLKTENEGLKARVSELEGTVQQLRSENASLHAQLFYHELVQGERSSPAAQADSESTAPAETPEGDSPAKAES